MANSSFPDWNSYEFIASELIEMEISLTLFLFDIESLQKNSWVRLKSKQILGYYICYIFQEVRGSTNCQSYLL